MQDVCMNQFHTMRGTHLIKKQNDSKMRYTTVEVLDKLLAFFFFLFCFVNIHGVEANKVSYGYKMEGIMFRKMMHLSLKQCHKECASRKICTSYNYIRSEHLCELNNADMVNASAYYTKFAKAVYGQDIDREATTLRPECSSCEDHEVCESLEDGSTDCFIRECQIPPPIYSGANTLGNSNSVGAKVKYNCSGDAVNLGNPVSQCTSTGNWSLPQFKCIPGSCWTQTSTSQYEVINVTTDVISAIMHVRCIGNFITRGSPIQCQDNGGYNLRYSCCDSPDENPWVRIYRIKSIDGEGPLGLWHAYDNIVGLDGNTAKDCQFRRHDIISNWSNLDILKVKVEIIVASSVRAWIIFNGQGSTNMNWFSAERINNSSWLDLSTSTSASLFSITGRIQENVMARFSIMESYSIDDCDITSGWLMIIARHMCFTAPEHIQFADGPYKATTATEFQSADTLEVSVEFAN